jgi:high-affinity nickel-transport protein
MTSARYIARVSVQNHMLNAFSLAVFGFLLGVRHALDPDHVVAMSTIATRSTSFRRAAAVGALWGTGHTLTLLLVGGAIVSLRIVVSPRAGLVMEFAVAVMLIILGCSNLLSAGRSSRPAPSAARPLMVGMVHGMAGSAAIALLVLATVNNSAWAICYLFVFGLGTIIGMVLVTGFVALPASLALTRVGMARRWLTVASGVASLAFGVMMAHALSGTGGVFSVAPTWVPR